MRVFITEHIDDQHGENQLAVRNATVADILDEARKYSHAAITVENASNLEGWTDHQRNWWKGIMLRQIAEYTGDSIGYWEAELKLGVMPDEFQPITTVIDGRKHVHLESITKLNRKQMREMIEGSVAYLRDEKRYGDKFHWITLPDSELRT